jgi:hypothetical protein
VALVALAADALDELFTRCGLVEPVDADLHDLAKH